MLDETPDRLGQLGEAVAVAQSDLAGRDAVARLWAADHTLWRPAGTEIDDRLGWLTVVPEMLAELEALRAQCATLVEGVDHVLVMGMGGSSLFPEVVARAYGPVDGHPRLHVVDSTDPAAVARLAADLPPDRTLHVAASKSGTTIETASQLAWAWERHPDPYRFAVITDAGSELEGLARARDFAAVWTNRSDIGGRYAALSYFGLVPAVLAGADVEALLNSASKMTERLRGAPAVNPGARLAAVMAAGVRAGRDKLTLVLPDRVASFGLWIEQLVAESTGKDGTGVVPVVGEPLGVPGVYGVDRLFVVLTDGDENDDVDGGLAREQAAQLDGLAAAGHPVWVLPFQGLEDLGAQVMLWEVATALCGSLLEIQPFDQPDVAAAKAATAAVLEGRATEDLPEASAGDLEQLLAEATSGDYLVLQLFADPESELVQQVEAARVALRDRLKLATTVGIGPRYLHSTGQLHKGGGASGIFVQVTPEVSGEPVDIPDQPFDFGTLLRAQADGDLATLRERNRRVVRVPLDVLRSVADT
jgi:transaldolase / glucose-6-phosphate isomerase